MIGRHGHHQSILQLIAYLKFYKRIDRKNWPLQSIWQLIEWLGHNQSIGQSIRFVNWLDKLTNNYSNCVTYIFLWGHLRDFQKTYLILYWSKFSQMTCSNLCYLCTFMRSLTWVCENLLDFVLFKNFMRWLTENLCSLTYFCEITYVSLRKTLTLLWNQSFLK